MAELTKTRFHHRRNCRAGQTEYRDALERNETWPPANNQRQWPVIFLGLDAGARVGCATRNVANSDAIAGLVEDQAERNVFVVGRLKVLAQLVGGEE